MQVNSGDWLAGRTLAELGLPKEGIMVLGFTRADGRFLGAPDGETEIKDDDVLILYGRATEIQCRLPVFAGPTWRWPH
ncbi:MAG: TrkA C-terminal domain-containing protein [Desulfosarcina sp.]|nr:TrkA C-terminal domain-containing protein [Desulfosarcina sp.]